MFFTQIQFNMSRIELVNYNFRSHPILFYMPSMCSKPAGEVLGFESLVLNIFDLIHALVETSRYRQVVKKSIEQLIYYIFYYMQITEEQVEGCFIISHLTNYFVYYAVFIISHILFIEYKYELF